MPGLPATVLLTFILNLPAAAPAPTRESATPAPPRPSDPGTMLLRSSAADLTGGHGFDVTFTTGVRDARGHRVGPRHVGRLSLRRTDQDVRIVVDLADGDARTQFRVENGRVTVTDEAGRNRSRNPERLLDDSALTRRLGPAAVHLLGLTLQDGFADFHPVGPLRRVDMGPFDGWLVHCRPSSKTEPGGEVRLAFPTSPPFLPLAVAVLLEDGCVVELEYHDWSWWSPSPTASAG